MTKWMPTLEEWKSRLDYDPETGLFHWKPQDGMNYWNARFAGKEAGSKSAGRYVFINLRGNVFLAHRIAWVFISGDYPKHEIDHINGDRFDNRAVNLRDVPHAINKRNLPRKASNTSGVVGVYRIRSTGQWCAQIRNWNGANQHIGNFSTIEEAAAARKDAERKFGFHSNHGRPL